MEKPPLFVCLGGIENDYSAMSYTISRQELTRELPADDANIIRHPRVVGHLRIGQIDWGLVGISCFLLWLCLLLFGPPQVLTYFSFKLGPGSVSVQDIALFILGAAALWLVEGKGQVRSPAVRTYLRFIAFWSLYCTALGLLSNAGQPLLTDWKRVEGLFAGVGLAILLHRSRYGAERLLLLFVAGTIIAALFATVSGLGSRIGVLQGIEGFERLGGLGINLMNGIWPIFLPLLLCRLGFSSRQRDKVLLVVALLVIILVVAANGARSTALSVFFSIVASFAWVVLTHLRLTRPAVSSGLVSHREVARNGLVFVVIALGVFAIVAAGMASDRVRPFLDGFAYRLTSGNAADLGSIDSRALEIREMVASMSPAQLIFGKGYGGTYHYSIAELWVLWGLYPSAFLIAPHILIAALFLKGGILLFLIGGVLLPLWCVRNLLLALTRPWPEYMKRVAPYDLAILGSMLLLYTSSLYDGTVVLSLSLLLTLRLYHGSLWSPVELPPVRRSAS